MILQVPKILVDRHGRTREILQEIHRLRSKSHLSEKDLRQIAELRVELTTLSPPKRFCWIDGLPVADVLDELVKIDRGGQ